MQEIKALIEKFLSRTISAEERKILRKWVLRDRANLEMFRKEIRDRSGDIMDHDFDSVHAFKSFLSFIERNRTYRRTLRYAAIFIVLVSTGYLVSVNTKKEEEPLHRSAEQGPKNNVVISLADGTQQLITSNGSMALTDGKGNVVAKREGGYLNFNDQDEKPGVSTLNEVIVPFGQTFKLILSDGTKVWLNAGTRFGFPRNLVAGGTERVVYLDGEAYFEVERNENRPFIVNADNIAVRVLGTHFNIMAYSSEDNIATTLVEGAVNVYESSRPDAGILLGPDYQATFMKDKGTLKKRKVDTGLFTSWMNNRLVIDNLTFAQVLKKLERTYNVTIINNAGHLENEVFKGEFENEKIIDVLATIASSTPFNYNIKENIITISK